MKETPMKETEKLKTPGIQEIQAKETEIAKIRVTQEIHGDGDSDGENPGDGEAEGPELLLMEH